jgi:hypothetical protein
VLHDSHQRRLVINRCWLIYDLITQKFRPLHEFHVEFPSLVELALISGYLQVPDHLHDEKGRICSFTGKIEDFVERASEIIESEAHD